MIKKIKHGEPFCSKDQLINDYIDFKLSYKDIAKKYKTSIRRVKKWITIYGITPRAKHSLKDLAGIRFGRLVAIKFIQKSERDEAHRDISAARWLCKCDCGKELSVISSSLIKGFTTSCGCYRRDKMFEGCGLLSGCLISRIKKGAKVRGLEFSLDKEFLWTLFLNQKQKCALSGTNIVLVRDLTKNRELNTASLDRIDHKKGYIKDNVRWVHKDINIMKNRYDDAYFIEMCRAIVKHSKRSNR